MSKHTVRRRLAELQRSRRRRVPFDYEAIEFRIADHMFGRRRRVRRTLVRLVAQYFETWPALLERP